jgi:hypothetical protein
VVFAAGVMDGAFEQPGVFRWEPGEQRVAPVAVPGMRAADQQTIQQVFRTAPPVINDRGEIAFQGGVQAADGRVAFGLYVMDAQGSLQPVALLGQALPDGSALAAIPQVHLNHGGVVAYLARFADGREAYYLWEGEAGQLAGPIAAVGSEALPGAPISAIEALVLNPVTTGGLVQVRLHGPFGPRALYRFTVSRAAPADPLVVALEPLVAPGLPLPGGGIAAQMATFGEGLLPRRPLLLPDAGLLAGLLQDPLRERGLMDRLSLGYLDSLDDGATAAYRVGGAGRLSLLLKRGTVTPAGTVREVMIRPQTAGGIGFNSRGQVALTAWLERAAGGVREAILLLTPSEPL